MFVYYSFITAADDATVEAARLAQEALDAAAAAAEIPAAEVAADPTGNDQANRIEVLERRVAALENALARGDLPTETVTIGTGRDRLVVPVETIMEFLVRGARNDHFTALVERVLPAAIADPLVTWSSMSNGLREQINDLLSK